MSTQHVVPNITSLFNAATTDGNLSPAGLAIVTAPDMGALIQAGMCQTPDLVQATEVTLVGMVIDDSSSIGWIPNGPDLVCQGQNLVIDAMAGSKQKAGIQVGTWLLNQDNPVQAFVGTDQTTRLINGDNYRASGQTPLYRRTVQVLASILADRQRWEDDYGVYARAVVIIVTDGRDEDYSSNRKYTAKDVKTLVTDLAESTIVVFMGIQNDKVDFRQIAREMGIPDQWILTPGNTESEIRRAFELASKSAVRASQSAANFSHLKTGGFTA